MVLGLAARIAAIKVSHVRAVGGGLAGEAAQVVLLFRVV